MTPAMMIGAPLAIAERCSVPCLACCRLSVATSCEDIRWLLPWTQNCSGPLLDLDAVNSIETAAATHLADDAKTLYTFPAALASSAVHGWFGNVFVEVLPLWVAGVEVNHGALTLVTAADARFA